jgi:ABC-type transporter Mla subunit MlaD
VAQKSARTTGRGAAGKARSGGEKSLDRVRDSIDAAQAALKDVRSEMNRSSRVLLKDVEKTLRDARKELRTVNRAVVKDLQEVQQTVRGQKPKTPRKTGATRRSAAKK